MTDYNFTRSKAKLNPAKTISKLLKMRSVIGADTAAGHRISNIDEIRQVQAKAKNPEQLRHLTASLERQLAELASTRSAS